jgi:hypothetical protein
LDSKKRPNGQHRNPKAIKRPKIRAFEIMQSHAPPFNLDTIERRFKMPLWNLVLEVLKIFKSIYKFSRFKPLEPLIWTGRILDAKTVDSTVHPLFWKNQEFSASIVDFPDAGSNYDN